MVLFNRLILLGPLLAAGTVVCAQTLDEMTVFTMAVDGSWGVATANSQGEAIAGAMRDCQAMASARNDCGAQLVTTRRGWIVAALCGDQKIMATGANREAAVQAALARESNLRSQLARDLPPCRRIAIVDPSGAAIVDDVARQSRSDVAPKGARAP